MKIVPIKKSIKTGGLSFTYWRREKVDAGETPDIESVQGNIFVYQGGGK